MVTKEELFAAAETIREYCRSRAHCVSNLGKDWCPIFGFCDLMPNEWPGPEVAARRDDSVTYVHASTDNRPAETDIELLSYRRCGNNWVLCNADCWSCQFPRFTTSHQIETRTEGGDEDG